MKKRDIAVNQFMEGYRCSQAVLTTYAQDLDIDTNLAKKISIGLAGGSGVGGECGAVSGAYLVIGLKYGFAHPGDPEQFGIVLSKTKAFIEKFKALHGDINCPKLIGLDVFSEEGHREFVENNIKASTCSRFVGDTVTILEDIFSS